MAYGRPNMPLCLLYTLLFGARLDRGMSCPNGPCTITNPSYFILLLGLGFRGL
jgi:hypothetical protein